MGIPGVAPPAEGNRGRGRPKGSANFATKQLKDMILAALDAADPAGGVGYLTAQAEKNPGAFLTLVGKVLPLQVNADHSVDVRVSVVERRIVDPSH